MKIATESFLAKMFRPIHFKNYSRRARKALRILFLDNLEEKSTYDFFEKELTESYHRHSKIEKGKIKIKDQIIQEMVEVSSSKQGMQKILNSLRIVKKHSFKGNQLRSGMLLANGQGKLFISQNNKCYILRNELRIEDLLLTFMKPELVSNLMNNWLEAISRIKDAKTYADTQQYDTPIVLFVENIS